MPPGAPGGRPPPPGSSSIQQVMPTCVRACVFDHVQIMTQHNTLRCKSKKMGLRACVRGARIRSTGADDVCERVCCVCVCVSVAVGRVEITTAPTVPQRVSESVCVYVRVRLYCRFTLHSPAPLCMRRLRVRNVRPCVARAHTHT